MLFAVRQFCATLNSTKRNDTGMTTKAKKTATISFPLTSIRPLYSSNKGKNRKIVFEADIKALKTINEPNTIDEMVAEARLEYTLGKTKTFTLAEELINELNS